MSVQCCLFLFLPLTLAFNAARPGCQTHCGDLAVPFPFGIGQNCSFDSYFQIHCNTSTHPPKAYMAYRPMSFTGKEFDSLHVINITESQVFVNYPNLAVNCYPNEEATNRNISIGLTGSPFTLSDNNSFTVIGCDNSMTFRSNFFTATCLASTDLVSSQGFCEYSSTYSAGDGCCTIALSKGTTNLLAYVEPDWETDLPCSYAVIAEKWDNETNSNISYPFDYLMNTTTFLKNNIWTSRPLVLDWRINSNRNCSEARKNYTTFACKENTICIEFDFRIPGYLCVCEGGYVGNPYLAGCQDDVNECEEADNNECVFSCTNTMGGYICSCPEGYYGDGRRDSIGCLVLGRSRMMQIAIGLAFGLGFPLLVVICLWMKRSCQKRKKRKHRERVFKRKCGLMLQQQTNEETQLKIKLYSTKELQKATDNFNSSRILGQGAQGTVYKGMLFDGRIVAIKKPRMIEENELEQFINEVVILSCINHKNVVKLLGCCLEKDVPVLVYEFVHNGTLFNLIHKENSDFPVTWNMRLKIATETSGALAYLHSSTYVPIFHRDIKSSNILLDEKYNAKVADFGISRSIAEGQTHLSTHVKGTFGYFDPEYFQTSQFTDKSDVFSFGVVLVELLTGQRPIPQMIIQDDPGLVTRFLLSMETNNVVKMLDVHVSEEGSNDEVILVARLAQRCLHSTGLMRPTMKEVAIELESIRMSQSPSALEVESLKAVQQKVMPIFPSDDDYTWTTSTNSATTTSLDTSPLVYNTM